MRSDSLQRALELEQIQIDDALLKELGVQKYFEKEKREKDEFFESILLQAMEKETWIECLAIIQESIQTEHRREEEKEQEKVQHDFIASQPTLREREQIELKEMEKTIKNIISTTKEYETLSNEATSWKESTWNPEIRKIANNIIQNLPDPLTLIPNFEKLSPYDKNQVQKLCNETKVELQERLGHRAAPADLMKHLPHLRKKYLEQCKKGGKPQEAMRAVAEPHGIHLNQIQIGGIFREFFAKLKRMGMIEGNANQLAANYANNPNVLNMLKGFADAAMAKANTSKTIIQHRLAEISETFDSAVSTFSKQFSELSQQTTNQADELTNQIKKVFGIHPSSSPRP